MMQLNYSDIFYMEYFVSMEKAKWTVQFPSYAYSPHNRDTNQTKPMQNKNWIPPCNHSPKVYVILQSETKHHIPKEAQPSEASFLTYK